MYIVDRLYKATKPNILFPLFVTLFHPYLHLYIYSSLNPGFHINTLDKVVPQ